MKGVDEMEECKICIQGVSFVVVGRKSIVVQLLLMDPISMPWVKDEHIWSNGGMIVDSGMPK